MKRERPSLVRSRDGVSYLLPFALVTLLFLLWGFAHGMLDVLNKHFQGAFTMSKAESGLVQFVTYIAYFLVALPAGALMKRFGYKRGILFGLGLFALGAFSFIPAAYEASAVPYLIALFVIACGLVFLETAANPYMTELGDRSTAASRLNLAQSFNGLGCICGPLIGGLLLFSDEGHAGISVPYALMGVVVLTVAWIFTRVKLPEVTEEETADASENRGSLWSHRLFAFGVLALFCYEIAEISINSFFINYVVETEWMSARNASVVLSFGGLGLFMCGRFAGSWIMRYIRAERVLLVCAIGTVATTATVVAHCGMASLIALFLGYAFEAIMFPTIFALSLRGLGRHTKRASSFLMMSPLGGAVGPLMMGAVADATSMSFSFIVPLLSFVVVLAYARSVNTVTSGQAPKRNGNPT